MELHERLAELERLFGKKHPSLRIDARGSVEHGGAFIAASTNSAVIASALLDAIAAEWWLALDGDNKIECGSDGVRLKWRDDWLLISRYPAPTIHEAVIAAMKARKNETV